MRSFRRAASLPLAASAFTKRSPRATTSFRYLHGLWLHSQAASGVTKSLVPGFSGQRWMSWTRRAPAIDWRAGQISLCVQASEALRAAAE